MSEKTFALTADVAEVPIDPVDWHYLGAQICPGDVVYINTVGTFGISSASYYWSRVGSSLGRLSQYISAHTAHTWHHLVADDFHLEAAGAGYREALLIFFVLCHTAGVPLSWSKTAGGDTVIWVGFEILHRSFSLGVSERRAELFVKWSETTAFAGYVNMDSFEVGLGRIAYVAGALEFERPFLAPLYRFLTLHPRGSTRRVPAHVSSILRYLANQLRRQRHHNCDSIVLQSEYAPRVDAQDSLERTGIRGWRPVKDKNGNIDTRLSPWFSVEIWREHSAPHTEKTGTHYGHRCTQCTSQHKHTETQSPLTHPLIHSLTHTERDVQHA